MGENKCRKCNKTIDEAKEGKYVAFDLQEGYQEVNFCSVECLAEWVRGKKFGMWATLAIGLVIAIVSAIDGSGFGIAVLFLPYTIRQVANSLSGGGEFLSICVVLVATATVVYPAYKFIQELREYSRLKAEYGF